MENHDTKLVSTYAVIVAITLGALVIIKVFGISYPLQVVSSNRTDELAVVGEGKVEAVPDTAYVDAGITINGAKSVQDAQNTINTVNNKIIEEMKSLGIPKENIKTSNYSIYPDYVYEGNRNRISGYNGSVTISIKMTQIGLASSVIEKVTAAGANQVQGVRFEIDNPQKYREQAREKAIANAKEQVKKLAKDLGLRVGKVTNIIETSSDMPPVPYLESRMSAMGGGGQPDIEPGSQTIHSTVTLYFEKR